MTDELEELYQEIILDHSRRPRNFGELADAAVRVHGDNPSCGDEIHLSIKFGGEGSLSEIKFTGQSCAISRASASMMTMKVKGKTRSEATDLLRAVENLITGDDHCDTSDSLGDLRLLGGVRKFPQRVKCAMLPWRALEQALEQGEGDLTVSTEGKE
jgi:nitrogen fixation NifU-like protein